MTTEQLRHRMPPILKALKERSLRGRTPVEGLRRTECAYHGWDTVHADAASWEPFAPGDAFGGLEAHHCFKGTVTLPEASAGKRVVCLVSTGASDIWNNNNPQFLAYVDGRLVCGLDTTRFRSLPARFPAKATSWRCTSTATHPRGMCSCAWRPPSATTT